MASGLDGLRGGSGRVDSERRLRLGENLDRGRESAARVDPGQESLEVADLRRVLVDESGGWGVGDAKARGDGLRIEDRGLRLEPSFSYALFVRSILCIYAFRL